MSTNQYPVFVDGQTLTKAELNDLRDFLHQRDRLVGRLVGFGVNAGLGGLVTTPSKLTIGPGLAIDQRGEPLLLPEAVELRLPPDVESVAYDFIDREPGGFSVVLESTDTIEPSPDCGEAGCTGHAELHTRAVTLRVVAGRVACTRMDFAAEALLSVEPIRLARDSSPTNSYETLRDQIVERLVNGERVRVAPGRTADRLTKAKKPLVDLRLIAKLQATSIGARDTAGIRGYKCGWLNMVLFATLDLLRARALLGLAWDRPTSRAGVVLGWVHRVGRGWVFDCAYRHAWEPPRGFTEAILGGSCSDPAGAFCDELEALLTGFAPPDPAPVGDPKPPVACPAGSIRVGGRCIQIEFPPPKIPKEWFRPWVFDLRAQPWAPPIRTWLHPDVIYQRPSIEVLGEKRFPLTDYLGHQGKDVKEVLTGFIGGQGAIADVRVISAGEVETLSGYEPAGGFAASDSVVFGVDGNGVVVSTGRVPTVQNVRIVGSALPAAVGAAAEASAAAAELRGMTTGFTEQFTAITGSIQTIGGDMSSLRTDFDTLKGGAFDQGGILARIAAIENQSQRMLQKTDQLDVLAGKVDVLQKVPRGRASKGLDPAFGKGLSEFAETTVAAMKSLPEVKNTNFRRYTNAADRIHSEFEIAVATGDPATIGQAALDLIDGLRTMVKASGVDPAFGRQLDAQYRQLSGLLR